MNDPNKLSDFLEDCTTVIKESGCSCSMTYLRLRLASSNLDSRPLGSTKLNHAWITPSEQDLAAFLITHGFSVLGSRVRIEDKHDNT